MTITRSRSYKSFLDKFTPSEESELVVTKRMNYLLLDHFSENKKNVKNVSEGTVIENKNAIEEIRGILKGLENSVKQNETNVSEATMKQNIDALKENLKTTASDFAKEITRIDNKFLSLEKDYAAADRFSKGMNLLALFTYNMIQLFQGGANIPNLATLVCGLLCLYGLGVSFYLQWVPPNSDLYFKEAFLIDTIFAYIKSWLVAGSLGSIAALVVLFISLCLKLAKNEGYWWVHIRKKVKV